MINHFLNGKTYMTTGRQAVQSTLHIPIVYDEVVPERMRWEYHLLSVDSHEQELPTRETLNELGESGWLLIGLVDERTTGKGSLVHYYFVRQHIG